MDPFHPTSDGSTDRPTYRLMPIVPRAPPQIYFRQDYATLLDIKDEVYSWWDHGLVAAAVHPDFPKQPYMYIAVRVGCD